MENIVTNVFLFEDKDGIKRFFGEVVQSNKYEKGHHILSSGIVSIDENIIKTENSKYLTKLFLSEEKFIAHIKDFYDKEKADFYFNYINFIKGN